MRILITGGLGFIGSNFVKYYASNHPEDTVINLDKRTYAASPIAYNELVMIPNYQFVLGDICDEALVQKLTKEVDAIVNFAAETHVDRSIAEPSQFVKTNVLGTINLLEAARKNETKRFHQISTDEIFGSLKLESKCKFSETTNYNPRNPYSASKASADLWVRSYYNTYGLKTTITICSNNFGPYQHPEKLIPKTILNLILNKPIPIYGDGRNVRDWLYVEDHCSAIDIALKNGKPGESYCVSAGNELSNIEVVKAIMKIIGRGNGKESEKLIQFVPDRPGHDRRYALDATKIISELGWRPKHQFKDSLKKTVAWYDQHFRDFIVNKVK